MKPYYLWSLMLGLLFVHTTCVAAMATDTIANHVPGSNESTMLIGDIRVVIDGSPSQQESYADMAKRIIRIRPGDRLTDAAIQASIDALKFSNRFAAIHVDSSTTPDGETLIYTLTPHRHIRDIRIRGAYPLFERDILNQMTIFPGDPYTDRDISTQVQAIVNRYRREGYIDPQVSITSQPDPGDETVVIFVNIDKGPHYTLGRLTFEGNQGISSWALRWRMRVWRAALVPGGIGRFSEFRLRKDMASLLTYYRRRGFADANLSYHMEEPVQSHQVNVTIHVQEGPRYRVDFEGNQHFWNLTLRKDVVIATDGNRNDIGVRRSLRNIRNRYRAAGYLGTQIKAETTDVTGDPTDIRQLRFIIHEGPQTIVNAVTIGGNQTLSEETIREQVLTRPPSMFHNGALVPETLEADTYAVTTLYMKQGFQERTVDSEVMFNEEKTGADVSLKIDEGPQTRVRSIAITGLTVLPEATARKALVHKPGDPFRRAALEVEKEDIASLVSEKGYPHVTVNASVSYSDDRTLADINLDVDPGPQVSLGDVFISGNLRTDETVIRRELKVQPGAPLSLRALHDGQRRLRDLAIFQGVRNRTMGLKEKNETVNVFVEVEENKPFYAQASVGYESNIGLFGRTRIGDRNLFGRNKDLWASGEISETGYRLETRLTEPRFLGTRVTASIGVFNEELTEFNQPFGTRTTGGSLGFGREWGKHMTTALSFSLEERNQFRVEEEPVSEVEEPTRTIFVTTPFIRYDSRDSFVRPTKGLLTSLGVDISTGLENDLDDFVRYSFDARYFYTPFERLTLAGLARIGHVWSYSDSDLVPDDQLFYLGGIRDVRGFKENLLRFDEIGDPVGGKTAIVGSLEARFELGMNLELTTFFDIGSVKFAQVDQGTDRFRPSVGAGLRYITPIGPMGLLYGYKLDRLEGESAGRVHVSIGYSF